MIPKKIGRYEIKAELGRGGMATVYRAYDESFDREVAIKVLPKEFLHDPSFRDRFKREIKIIAALEHPAIVPVHDVGEDEGVPYFVMRYMPGGSLSNMIEKGNFSIQDAARIIERLASALAYAHKRDIIHRDLKPDNILFDANGEPYISDFGVASFASGSADLTGENIIGTPAYMSPEQAQGDKVDGRSDIYGLGVIVYQMLSGQQPYHADTPMGVAIKQITDPVPDILKNNPNLPKATDTIIKTAMAKNRDDRYATATDLGKALLQAAAADTESANSSPVPSKLSSNSRVFIFAGLGALIILIAIAGSFFLKNSFFSSQPTATVTAAATETVEPTETVQPEVVIPDFFTEDFDGNLESWSHFIVGNQESEIKAIVENSFLNFEIVSKEQKYYTYYNLKTYNNVRIDLSSENRGDFNSITAVVCRYHENEDWYEFNFDSGGLYQILYVKFNDDKIKTSSTVIANGGSTLINAGKAVNEYSVICNDRTLSLLINGAEVSRVVDNDFVLEDGYVGIGFAADKFVPVKNRIDSFSISEP